MSTAKKHDLEEVADWVPAKTAYIFFALGVTYRLFYSFLLSTAKLMDAEVFPGTNWKVMFARCSNGAYLVGFIACIKYINRMSFKASILGGGMITTAGSIAFVGVFRFFPGTTTGFYLALACCFVISLGAAMQRAKALSVAIIISSRMSRFDVWGGAFAGLLATAVTAAFLRAVSDLSKESTDLFLTASFAFCIIWNFFSGFAFSFFEGLYADAMRYANEKKDLLERVEEAPITASEPQYGSSLTSTSYVTKLTPAPRDSAGGPPPSVAIPMTPHGGKVDPTPLADQKTALQSADQEPVNLYSLFWVCKRDLFALIISNFTTFCLFPGVLLSWTAPSGWSIQWFNLYLNMLFQSGDNTGRVLTKWPMRRIFVLPSVLARLSFLPLCIVVMRHPYSSFWGSLIFQSLLVYSLGLSVGYVTCCSFMYGSSQARNPREKAVMGPMLPVAGLIGMVCGTGFDAARYFPK